MVKPLPTTQLWKTAEKINKKLPKHWSVTPLDQLAEVKTGFSFKSKFFTKNKGIPLIRIRDLDHNKTKTFYDGDYDPSFFVEKGDLLVGMDGDFRCVEWQGEKCLLNQRICKITPNKKLINPRLFRYWFNIYLNAIQNSTSSQTVTHLSSKTIASTPFPIPPIEEQSEIISTLDSINVELESTKKYLEMSQTKLQYYELSLLKNSFEGNLTKQWRKNNTEIPTIENTLNQIISIRKQKNELDKGKKKKSKKLLDIHILGKNSKIDSWLDVKLENLVYISGRIGWKGLKADEYLEKGPLFISVPNLNHGGYVDFSTAQHISQERYDESPEIKLKNNDILLVKDGAGIGKLSMVKNLKESATVNSSLLVVRSPDCFVPKFLFYFLYGPELQNVVQERITGSATPHLFQRDIKEFVLSIPPLEEQQQIVKIIEDGLSEISLITDSIRLARKNLDLLKKSIFFHSLQGKLTKIQN